MKRKTKKQVVDPMKPKKVGLDKPAAMSTLGPVPRSEISGFASSLKSQMPETAPPSTRSELIKQGYIKR